MILGITAGGYPIASGPTINPNASVLSSNWVSPSIALSGRNLTCTKDTTAVGASVGSIDAKTTGKWYFEAKVNNLGGSAAFTRILVGVGHANWNTESGETLPVGTAALAYRDAGGGGGGFLMVAGDNVGTSYGGAWLVNDIISVAVDADARTVQFRRNNGGWSSPVTLGGTLPIMPLIRLYGPNASVTLNFGRTAFEQTPLTGYGAWVKNSSYSGRYWRRQTFRGLGSGQAIAEINFRTAVGAANIDRTGATASASTVFPGFPASNAIDTNNGSFWSSNGEQDTAWFQIDFGSAIEIKEILETKRADINQYFFEAAYQYSNNGSSWMPGRAAIVPAGWTFAQETKQFSIGAEPIGPELVGAQIGTRRGGGTITLPAPVTTGNLLVCVIATGVFGSAVPNPASGFVKGGDFQIGGGGNFDNFNLSVWYKPVRAGNSSTVTFDGGIFVATLYEFKNAIAAMPIVTGLSSRFFSGNNFSLNTHKSPYGENNLVLGAIMGNGTVLHNITFNPSVIVDFSNSADAGLQCNGTFFRLTGTFPISIDGTNADPASTRAYGLFAVIDPSTPE